MNSNILCNTRRHPGRPTVTAPASLDRSRRDDTAPPAQHPLARGAPAVFAEIGDSGESVARAWWPLPDTGRAVAAARNLAQVTLEGWGLASVVDDVMLAVDELVANAFANADPPYGLQILHEWRHRTVCVAVYDASPDRLPVLTESDPLEEHGRGLWLLAQLASAWGTRIQSGSKVVWAVFPS